MTDPRPKAVLLDRDGVLNVKAATGDYIRLPEALRLLPGAGAALARLNRAGIAAFVVTNQRGVALGRMSEAGLEAVHRRLHDLLAAEGAHLDAVYYCPHAENACDCRKPEPGLLLRAMQENGLAPADCLMIGDSPSDMLAARAAGVRGVYLGEDDADCHWRAASLNEAVARILGDGD